MKKWSVTILMIVLSCYSMAQDSLRLVFDHYIKTKGRERIHLANVICKQLNDKKETDTLYIFDHTSKNEAIDFLVLKNMANHYLALHELDSALAFSKKAMRVYKPGICDNEYAECLNTISVICQRTGRFYEALTAQKECYEYDIKSGDPESMSSSTNNLACLYLATNQFSAARNFILKSIEIEQHLNHEDRMAIRYGSASEIYLNLDSLDKALQFAQMAYQLDKKGGRTEKMAIRLSELASVYIKMNKLKEAHNAIGKALPILQQYDNIHSEAICHNQLGDIYLMEKKNAMAANQYREATGLAKRIGNRLIEKKAQRGLAQAIQTQNPIEALQCMQRYVELSDSLYKEESASEFSQFHSIYMAKELDEKNAVLNSKNEAQRRYLIYVSVIFILIFLLLASLIGLLYHMLRMRNKSNNLLKEIEEMRLDFFTKITHEFRSPLTIINGLSEHITKGKMKKEEVYHAAEMILRNGQQLQLLTNQLLDISKMRASFIEPHWRHGNIEDYTKITIETFSQLASQKNIDLNYRHIGEDNNHIDFVPDLYNKIIYNLLSNALKYTQPEGCVSVTTEIKSRKLILTVKDTGIGIPKKDFPHIFEEYYIGDATNCSISTGVGLALVKQISDTLEGTIQVESHEGEGTIFVLELPAMCPSGTAEPLIKAEICPSLYPLTSQHAANENGITEETSEMPKILIVEDNEDVSRFISVLAGDKYQIIQTDNGADGLKKAREVVPDLILSDLVMPKMNGIELCREIRKDEMLSHIPFIIITANPDEDERIKGLDSGADSYLLKPFSVEELTIRIKRLIEQRENMRKNFSRTAQGKDNEIEAIQMPQRDFDFLQKLEDCIQQQMVNGNTDVETIASELCVSSKQLRRKIFALTNMTSVAYILHVRLSKAKELLMQKPQMSISEISLQCGFDDSGYFTKAFKQHYGVTPSTYRKEGKTAD